MQLFVVSLLSSGGNHWRVEADDWLEALERVRCHLGEGEGAAGLTYEVVDGGCVRATTPAGHVLRVGLVTARTPEFELLARPVARDPWGWAQSECDDSDTVRGLIPAALLEDASPANSDDQHAAHEGVAADPTAAPTVDGPLLPEDPPWRPVEEDLDERSITAHFDEIRRGWNPAAVAPTLTAGGASTLDVKEDSGAHAIARARRPGLEKAAIGGIGAVLEHALDAAFGLVDCARAFLLVPDRHGLKIGAAIGEGALDIAGGKVDLHAAPGAQFFKQPTRITYHGPGAELRWRKGWFNRGSLRVRSLLAAPLRRADGTIEAVLVLADRTGAQGFAAAELEGIKYLSGLVEERLSCVPGGDQIPLGAGPSPAATRGSRLQSAAA